MADKSHDGDVAFIKALAELLEQNDLTEIEVMREYGEDDSLNVRVSRQMAVAPAPAYHAPAPAAPQAQATPAAPATPATGGDPAQDPDALTSPMVGTAYLAPEPGSPNFVSVGDKVAEGQTLMIVEAMKTMNQIPSPRAGTVTRILIGDGDPVEFGSPLMIIS
ncbi:acetyl-CoA carboxylase biotin carboxyl carrier protein [Alterinioella nitratireducens]|uniref:acetyl-CoA carboxylase biotin carboxyl carrier protein n=1 Tax=Alterinioella nitratireducens TaxID=2735915 RepID=UPI001556E5F5|nr:acetyl-CoA carboxylase biotin carboxyl carrier protein [Alterinioella nitratireducens]NPD18220.1 acetyl-CoA carboxylase biotin carboxyl carrier protein [Alterinioella nitratireducens]